MAISRLLPASLTGRFALASAALAAVALLFVVLGSLWLVTRQQQNSLEQLRRQQVEYHAESVAATLNGIATRMAEVSRSSILATGLVDSAGRETYLGPFLNSIEQIGGIPVEILFTDFEGREVASNRRASFEPGQRQWLSEQLLHGLPQAAIFATSEGPELVAYEPLSYSRTASPEGAVMYKLRLADLGPVAKARILWNDAPPPDQRGLLVPIEVPAIYQQLGLQLFEDESMLPSADSAAPHYLPIFIIALVVAALVLLLGSRLALRLTADLRRLEAFSRDVIDDPTGLGRADQRGSEEVSSLARSINQMLQHLYEQRDLLQRETDKLHQLANTIPQLAWMANADGWIHWFNDRFYEYTGLPHGNPRGMSAAHHPDYRPQVSERWAHSIRTGEPFEMTFPLRSASGEYRTFFTRAAPLRDAGGNIIQWFGTNTDVTPLEQAEKALRESRERLQEGMLAARMSVWEWDLRTGELDYSANATNIFGLSGGGVAGVWSQIEPDDLQQLHECRQRAIDQRSEYRRVVRMKQPTATGVKWLDIRGRVMCDPAGTPVSIRGISLDVTERRDAEERLREADRRKDEFLAMLAHELRNPLAPIANAAEIFALGKLDEAGLARTGEIIRRQAQHMTRLIDDLLDVSRVTRGLVTIKSEDLDVNQLVQGAVEQVRSLIDSRQHFLTIVPAGAGAAVRGDPTRLVQVIANLLNNAAKYTPVGGRITVWSRVEGGQVLIGVRDNGNGIAESLLPHVFELFSQGDRSPDRSQGGLGLGLALVKSLVTLHGGSVEVHSDGVGKGSEFILRLPAARAPALPQPVPERVSPCAARGGCRVIIVDDNVDAARTVATLVEMDGHEVTVCEDAACALQHAAALAPDAMILDIGLPDMDGYQLARRLRHMPQTADTLLIALTGYGSEQDTQRAIDAQFDHHLVKPAKVETILKLLQQGPVKRRA